MTKEEIKTLIDTKIAGQGTNVDGGGALATILNGIVDAMPEGGGGAEPLILEGTVNEGGFSPAVEFPTKQQIVDAYTQGNLIYQKVRYDGVNTVFSPVEVFYNSEEKYWYVRFSFGDVSSDYLLE